MRGEMWKSQLPNSFPWAAPQAGEVGVRQPAGAHCDRESSARATLPLFPLLPPIHPPGKGVQLLKRNGTFFIHRTRQIPVEKCVPLKIIIHTVKGSIQESDSVSHTKSAFYFMLSEERSVFLSYALAVLFGNKCSIVNDLCHSVHSRYYLLLTEKLLQGPLWSTVFLFLQPTSPSEVFYCGISCPCSPHIISANHPYSLRMVFRVEK